MSMVRPVARVLNRAIGGPQPWGTLEVVSPIRYGWRSLRLSVYPPGTTAAERRLLWLDRNAPILVAMATLAVIVLVQPRIEPLEVLLTIPLGILIVAVVRRSARRLRTSVRVLTVTWVGIDGRPSVNGDEQLLGRSAETLKEIDRRLRRAEISPVEYERRWGEVYESLAETV